MIGAPVHVERGQGRMRAPQDRDEDGNADMIISDWSTQQISVVFFLD